MKNNEIQNVIIKEDLFELFPEIVRQEIEKGNRITIIKIDGQVVVVLPSLKEGS